MITAGYVLDHHLQTSQTFISGEIEELQRQGLSVRVVACRRGDRDLPPDPAVLHLSDAPASTVEGVLGHLRWAVRRPLRYVRFLTRLWRNRSDLGPAEYELRWQDIPRAARHLEGVDVLHAHFAWTGAALASLLAPLLSRRWSMTVHANDIFSRQRNLRFKLGACDTLVTVCDYNTAWMQENLGLTRPVEKVICGVEVPEPENVTPSVDVCTVARLVPKKGVDTLLRAVAQLRDRGVDATLQVVGGGKSEHDLRELTSELGIADRVTFSGVLPHDEALRVIARARVFCLAARIAEDGDRDSMPVVVKEAMVRGVAVVATNVVAIPEMVDDEVGRLVPPDNPVALAEALHELLTQDGLSAALGAEGRRRALARFTLEGEVSRLVRVLAANSVT